MKFQVGDKVKVTGQVKDAVIIRIVLAKKKPGRTMYQVEYTPDDAVAREMGYTDRHQQPWFERDIQLRSD